MFLLDGHNIIGSGLLPGIDLGQEDDEARLAAYMRARQPNLAKTIMLVFDGGIPGGFSPDLSGGGVRVRFAAAARGSADEVILAQVRTHGQPHSLTVVTNDAALRREALALGAHVQNAEDFLQALNSARRRPHRRVPRPPVEESEKPRPTAAENEELLRLFTAAKVGKTPRSRR